MTIISHADTGRYAHVNAADIRPLRCLSACLTNNPDTIAETNTIIDNGCDAIDCANNVNAKYNMSDSYSFTNAVKPSTASTPAYRQCM